MTDTPTFGPFATRAINLMRQFDALAAAATDLCDDVGGQPVEHDMQPTLKKLEKLGRHLGTLIYDIDWREAAAPAEEKAEKAERSLAYWDTWDRADNLRKLARLNCPPESEVRQALENCMPADGVEIDDDNQPALPALQAAIVKFDALPLDERRRILNGWTPGDPEDYDRSVFLDDIAGSVAVARRVLAIEAGCARDGGPTGDWWMDFNDGDCPIRFLFREGLTKEQALSALEWMTLAVRDHFHRLISDPANDAGRLQREARWETQDAAGIPRTSDGYPQPEA